MDDQNPIKTFLPLQSSETKQRISNKSGRPKLKNILKFGPQPKSIVALMLSELTPRSIIHKKRNVYSGDIDNLEFNNTSDLIITKGEQRISCLPSKSPVIKHETSEREGSDSEVVRDVMELRAQPNSVISELNIKVEVNNSDNETIIGQNETDLKVCKSEHVSSILFERDSSDGEHRRNKLKTEQFFCDFPKCVYSCKLSSNIIKHKRVHTNEKPYLCEKCPFRTNFVNSLKVHRRIHTSDRPYQCLHCRYKCNSSSNLKKHCRHRHSDD